MSRDDFDLDPLSYYEFVNCDPSKLRFPEPGEDPQFDKIVEARKRMAELLRSDKLMEVDKKIRPMRKAELMEYAHELAVENQMLWLELGKPGAGQLGAHVMREQNVIIDSQEGVIRVQKKKARNSSSKTNQANIEFWKPWKARYHELRKDGIKVMAARRKVKKEIFEDCGRTFALDGALKKQLK